MHAKPKALTENGTSQEETRNCGTCMWNYLYETQPKSTIWDCTLTYTTALNNLYQFV